MPPRPLFHRNRRLRRRAEQFLVLFTLLLSTGAVVAIMFFGIGYLVTKSFNS